MGQPMVNGEKYPHSQTIEHFTSYPVASDLISIFRQNSLGARSISLFDHVYTNYATPFFPYFQTPYSYVSPYINKADEIGDSSLSTVDNHFPAIKQTNLDSLQQQVLNVALFPLKLANESKNYVFATYNDEHKKVGDQGLVTFPKVVIGTELRIASEAMHAIADYLGPKKEQAQQEAERLRKMGEEKFAQVKKTGQQKKEEAQKQVNSN